MRLLPSHCSLFVLAFLGALTAAQADTVLDHANGYTLNSKNELVRFAALAFDDNGKIIAVGSAAEVNAKAPKAKHVDLVPDTATASSMRRPVQDAGGRYPQDRRAANLGRRPPGLPEEMSQSG